MSETTADQFGPVDPASVWRSADRDLAEFRLDLSAIDHDSLIKAIDRSIEAGRPVVDLTDDDLPLGPLGDPIARLRDRILHGSGLAIVSGFPTDRLSPDQTERFFWAVGLRLGRPVSQSVMGERLGHIRDVTRTDPNARAYRNRSELTPHTDPADVLSFLCIHPAAKGGISRFVSAMAIHEEIRQRRPDLLTRLYRGYRYHRLGEQQPGCPDITPHRIPVFSQWEQHTSCRYVRQYLEVAADEDPEINLDTTDREALELFESLAADPDLHFEFRLQSGEAVFANNFTVLHARSGFEDDPNQPARHLLRLWLAADPARPVAATIEHFEGEPGILPIPGRTPSYATKVEVQ